MAAPVGSTPNYFFLFFFIFTAALVNKAYTNPIQEPKQTNIVVYGHEYFKEPHATETIVAGKNGATNSEVFQFGTVVVIDNPITEAPSNESKEIGRAQGFFLNSQLDGKAVHVSFSIIFTDGEFKGSTLQIQGPDEFTLKEREFAVLSGAGHFRFVKGYGIMETLVTDLINLRTVIKLNITVNHYEFLSS